MSKPDFVHLHVHSEYSLLDGANRIADLVEACKQDGQGALALTDHGNMFGAIELYQACVAGGIKPVLGCEVYIAKRSRFEPHSKKENGYHHLTLLARNAQGYKNLLEIASTAYLEGYHFRPRGSSASRSPSPMKLIESTVRKIIAPGISTTCGAIASRSFASNSKRPHVG